MNNKPSSRNTLNDLNGKEWIYNTNSIESFETEEWEREFNKFVIELIETRYSTKGKESFAHHIRKSHPTPKPPQLMERLIRFFSKKGELVFDPFMGVGGTLLASSMAERNCIGIDLSEKYINIYKEANQYLELEEQKTIIGDARDLDKNKLLEDKIFDLIVTDPPYGNMMNRIKTGHAARTKKSNQPTPFSTIEGDIGNLEINEFLIELKEITEKAVKKLRNKRYLIVFTKDFQPKPDYDGMLHSDIVKALSKINGLLFKGMKIWFDKSMNLFPYGYPYAYVGNQLHQYILIFRKEEKN
ncbi:DNA methyltransferase [Salinimicrobium soli]|uniref:DNA methyltransferase n=2 Tax=Bacteria TaxID=2 RepID=UPI003AABFC3D